MTTQHTPERLRVATDGSLGSIETVSGKSIGQTFQTRHIRSAADHEERIANARRLVACWNACQNIDTETLGQFEIGFISAEHARVLIERTRQRDELLAALKDMNAAFVGLLHAGYERIVEQGGVCDPVELMEASNSFLKASRAAIAKAESGAA